MPPRRELPLAVALAVCSLLSVSTAARAQSPGLSSILVELLTNDIVLQPNPANPAFSHEAHFKPGVNVKEAPYLFNQSVASQVSTFPLGASTGGFSYRYNPETGAPERLTESFGPAFAERARTIGRKHWELGFNYQHVAYDSFEGTDLENGGLTFYIRHQDAQPGQVPSLFFEGDLVRADLSLKVRTDTIALFGTVGVTDRLDIGIAVPMVRVEMDAGLHASVVRLSTSPNFTQIHRFADGSSEETLSRRGSATGIGDVLLRAKFRFLDTPGGGLAAGLDVRLPTGDKDNLLGTGATQTKVALIGSTAVRRLSPHMNVGYTFSSGGSSLLNVTDEFNYAAGVDLPVHPTLTLAADVFGRTLRNFGRLRLVDESFLYQVATPVPGGSPSLGPVQEFVAPQYESQPGNLNLTYLALGGKFNPWRNLLLAANVLIPVSNAGLKARPIPVVGLNVAF